MSLIHRMSEPVRTPVRRVTNHYAIFFEDLIHAVKNEVMAKLNQVDERSENIDRSLNSSYEAISDQLAIQTATVRSLGAEVALLRSMLEAQQSAGPVVDLDSAGNADGVGTTASKSVARAAKG